MIVAIFSNTNEQDLENEIVSWLQNINKVEKDVKFHFSTCQSIEYEYDQDDHETKVLPGYVTTYSCLIVTQS